MSAFNTQNFLVTFNFKGKIVKKQKLLLVAANNMKYSLNRVNLANLITLTGNKII